MNGARENEAVAVAELTSARARLEEIAIKFGAACAAIPEGLTASESNKLYPGTLEIALKHAAKEFYRAFAAVHSKNAT
jgi:hypothetical protein